MTLENWNNERLKVFAQNQKLTFVAVCLVALLAWFAWLLVEKASSERVVFLPPFQPTKEFWATSSAVSATYLEQMGQYITSVVLNITPESSKHIKGNILPLVPSEHWADVDKALNIQLAYIQDNAITRIFHPSSFKWDIPNKLQVRGLLREISRGDVVATRQSVVVTIDYKIENSRWWLLGISIENGR
jgi:type IV conjugative transfer system protein TraE